MSPRSICAMSRPFLGAQLSPTEEHGDLASAAAPLGGFQGVGESPLPLAPAEKMTMAGPYGTGTLCRAWSKGYAGRKGHNPKESTGEPSVTSRERWAHFWLGLPVPEQGGETQRAWQRAAGAWPGREGKAARNTSPQLFFCFSQCPEEPVLGSWEWRHMPLPAEQLKQPKISHCTHLYPKGT